jgi:hypothetical protein
MILAPLAAQACPLKVVKGEGGTLSVINTAAGSAEYVYAAVVRSDHQLTRLEDIMASGTPLERANAKAKKYALPKNAPGASLYLVTSQQKLEQHDRFRVNPAAEKELRIAKSSRSRGMSNYGGPLPEPAIAAPEVASPAGVDVCTTRIGSDRRSLLSADLP